MPLTVGATAEAKVIDTKMDLRQRQSYFTKLIGQLIVWVYQHPGWELTFGEGYDDDFTGHMAGSLHYYRLAQDLNLFINGAWIKNGDHPVWKELGDYWKSLDKDCAWGGDFTSRDSNHFSLREFGRA